MTIDEPLYGEKNPPSERSEVSAAFYAAHRSDIESDIEHEEELKRRLRHAIPREVGMTMSGDGYQLDREELRFGCEAMDELRQLVHTLRHHVNPRRMLTEQQRRDIVHVLPRIRLTVTELLDDLNRTAARLSTLETHSPLAD
jgi:hypothetical protein